MIKRFEKPPNVVTIIYDRLKIIRGGERHDLWLEPFHIQEQRIKPYEYEY